MPKDITQALPEPSKEPCTFSEEQKEIAEGLLRLFGPEAMGFFEDAHKFIIKPNDFYQSSNFFGLSLTHLEETIRHNLYLSTTITGKETKNDKKYDEIEARIITAFKESDCDVTKDNSRLEKFINSFIHPETHADQIRAIGKELSLEASLIELWISVKDNSRIRHISRGSAIKPVNDEIRDRWYDFQTFLKKLIPALERKYTVFLEKIDEIKSSQKFNYEDFQKLPRALIIQQYFFKDEDDPKYLEPLNKKDYFNKFTLPPTEISDEALISELPWPAGQYLTRMAKKSETQKIVSKIIGKIPETNNPWINLEIIKMLKNLPAELSINHFEKLNKCIQKLLGTYFLSSREIVEILKKWADAAKFQEIYKLLNVLLPPLDGENENYIQRQEYIYVEVVRGIWITLIEKEETDTIKCFCNILADRLGQKYPNGQKDTSYYVRNRISENKGPSHNILNCLVDIIRDGSVKLIDKDRDNSPKILKLLQKHKWLLFERLGLYIMSRFPSYSPEITTQMLTNKQYATHHEYEELLEKGFPHLPEVDKKSVLNTLDVCSKEPPNGDSDTPNEAYLHRKLNFIAENLPSKWKTCYQQLHKKHKSPLPPESTKTDLIIEKLFISEENFTEDILDETTPEEIQGALSEIEMKVLNGERFDWQKILIFCGALISKSFDTEEKPVYDNVCYGITKLMEVGVARKEETLIDFSDVLWKILEFLIEYKEDGELPSPSDAKSTYYDIANSTIRGRTTESIIKYLLWLKELDNKENSLTDVLEKALGNCRSFLDSALKSERNEVIRSICGRFFSWINDLDENWVAQHIQSIFAQAKGDDPGWQSYILFDPHPYKILEESYIGATKELSKCKEDPYQQNLSEIIICLMLRGETEIDGELIQSFISNSSDINRATAIHYISKVLVEGNLEDKIIGHIKEYLESRLKAIQQSSNLPRFQKETSAMVKLIGSKHLEAKWQVDILLEGALELATGLSVDTKNFIFLSKLFKTKPLKTLEYLEEILFNSKIQMWEISSHKDSISEILKAGSEHKDQSVKEKAEEISSILISQGHSNFYTPQEKDAQ